MAKIFYRTLGAPTLVALDRHYRSLRRMKDLLQPTLDYLIEQDNYHRRRRGAPRSLTPVEFVLLLHAAS